MKKITAIALVSLALVGCDAETKIKAPAVSLEQVSNVCSNMVKTYIQDMADISNVGSEVRFMRYEGLDHLIERQCSLTSMNVRNEKDPMVRKSLGVDLSKDVAEFASDQYTASRYTLVNNAVGMAELYAGKLAQAEDAAELNMWINKIKSVQ